MSLNGYSYVEGNVPNATDPSGQCSFNNSSTFSPKWECSEVTNDYIRVIEDVYGPQMNWSSEIWQLFQQEMRYWNTLPYNQFVAQWNSSRPPNRTVPESGLQQGANIALGAAAITGPTPDDFIWLAGALCLYAVSLAVQAGAIALPLRQQYHFLGATALNYQPQVFTAETDGEFRTAITRGETFVTDWANTQNSNNDHIKLLYRGTSLTGARRAAKAAWGEITWSDLVTETDQNKFWLASSLAAVVIYAATNAAQRREGRGAILIYAILRSRLQSLIATGNVTNRAGGPPPIDVGLEYGFDVVALPSLFGPAVISR